MRPPRKTTRRTNSIPNPSRGEGLLTGWISGWATRISYPDPPGHRISQPRRRRATEWSEGTQSVRRCGVASIRRFELARGIPFVLSGASCQSNGSAGADPFHPRRFLPPFSGCTHPGRLTILTCGSFADRNICSARSGVRWVNGARSRNASRQLRSARCFRSPDSRMR